MPVSQTQIERIVIVTRKTELDQLVVRFTTVQQAKFYIEHAGHNFDRIRMAHDVYYQALDRVKKQIPREIKVQLIDRSLLPQFVFDAQDLVLVVGQDGLVSNTAKYLEAQPILGINPNPELYDGVLLPFTSATAGPVLHAALEGTMQIKRVTLGQAQMSDGQDLLAFNDFFVGARSHISARYIIRHGQMRERHSSSGIIISTGAGTTGWMRSVLAGANRSDRSSGWTSFFAGSGLPSALGYRSLGFCRA